MIGWLLLVGVVVAIVWDEIVSRRTSNGDKEIQEARWDIGVTVPKKYNLPEDEWYDPNLPFWNDKE